MFALVDCNNFYASCERLFRPGLEGRPVVVLSNNDGCVIARSNEAKVIGIGMGAAFHLIKDQLRRDRVAVFSSNYALYGDMSARVMQVLSDRAPATEVYSIDEAFLDLDGLRDPAGFAQDLRREVRRWTGIPVSIGIARTKTLAKVANRMAKKDAVLGGVGMLADDAAVEDVLGRMDVTDLWGVAGRTARRLEMMGIRTALELKRADPREIRREFSVVMERMVRELNCISCLPLEMMAQDKKQIIASRSFGGMIDREEDLREAIASYAARAAEKLRRGGLVARHMGLFLRTNRFRPDLPQYNPYVQFTLPEPVADSTELVRISGRLLKQAWRPGFRWHKGGVVLMDLCRAGSFQPDMLAPVVDRERRGRLMEAMDAINRDWGRDTVRIAATGVSRGWSMRQGLRSPRYTTRWDELARVRSG